MKVNVKQIDSSFQLSSSNGSEEIYIGVSQDYQKNTTGLRPMELLLSSLGACISIDVINLFKKKRIDIEDFNVSVNGVRDHEPPKAFNAIHIEIECIGRISADKLIDIVSKVLGDYCSVFHSLDKSIKTIVLARLNGDELQIS
ncbi:MAG: OsmC family protein [Saprospiraceae bacterium]|nr:OsmC family protein [Saprospiraceae bacterium]